MNLKKSIIANYIGQGWATLMGVAFVPLYIHALGMEAYGLVGIFTVLQGLLNLLDFGLTPTLNRAMARLDGKIYTSESIRDLLRSFEIIFLSLSLIMVITIWFISPLVATEWLKTNVLSKSIIIEAIQIMGLVIAMRWLEQIYRSALLGRQDHVWFNMAQAVLATLRWGGAYIVVAFVSPTISAFFMWQATVSLLAVITLISRTYKVLPPSTRSGQFSKLSLLEIRGFAGSMFISSILAFILTQSDKIIISKIASLDQLGYYMLAATASGALLQLITPMNNAIYPRLTELASSNDNTALTYTYQNACNWMAAIIIPPALVLAFFADSILLLWTGDLQLTQAVKNTLALLVLGVLFNGLMNIPYMLQLAHGWVSLSITINAIAIFLIVPVMILTVPIFGIIGAAAAWLVLNFSYLIVTPHLIHKRLLPGIKWQWYRESLIYPLFVGILTSTSLFYILPAATNRADSAQNIVIATIILYVAVTNTLSNVRRYIYRHIHELFYTNVDLKK